MHADGPALIGLLAPGFATQCQGADANLVSRAFDDSKLDEHFAIIPTKSVPQRSALRDVEAKVYEAIVLRYLKIGRASCRERVCPYGYISVVAVALKKKK